MAFWAGLPELDKWVSQEIDGYETSAGIPSYRGPSDAMVLAHLVGPFGAQTRNYPLPPLAFEEKIAQGHLFKLVFLESVAELERIATVTEQGWEEWWPAGAVAIANTLIQSGRVGIRSGYLIAKAHKVIPPQAVVGVLDAVRTRIMNLAVGLEKLVPENGTHFDQDLRLHADQIFSRRYMAGRPISP